MGGRGGSTRGRRRLLHPSRQASIKGGAGKYNHQDGRDAMPTGARQAACCLPLASAVASNLATSQWWVADSGLRGPAFGTSRPPGATVTGARRVHGETAFSPSPETAVALRRPGQSSRPIVPSGPAFQSSCCHLVQSCSLPLLFSAIDGGAPHISAPSPGGGAHVRPCRRARSACLQFS